MTSPQNSVMSKALEGMDTLAKAYLVAMEQMATPNKNAGGDAHQGLSMPEQTAA
jgi:hypothetical protein